MILNDHLKSMVTFKQLSISLISFLVISYESLISINNLSNEILEYIMKYLNDRQLKQSCLKVNKQWNQCASKGSLSF
jgi:hypothetical protein